MNREYLKILVIMANEALFTTEPKVTVHNAEGAILLQLLFQVYQGTTILNEFFEEILGIVLRRMNQEPMDKHLKRHLLGVILTALAYNS